MAQTDFTIKDVLEWARTKPADERYNYTMPMSCALCHFLRDTGRCAEPIIRPFIDGCDFFGWRSVSSGDRLYKPYDAALEPALMKGGTFGGLVRLLEALCPETPVTQSNWSAIDAYLTAEQVPA